MHARSTAQHWARRGFSLVEIMIAVAIIGILASLGTAHWMQAQLKAKRAEPYPNLRGIADAQLAYEAAYDDFAVGASNPGPPLDKTAKAWVQGMSGWIDLAWEPDGAVRCTYITSDYGSGLWVRNDAYCDIDDDNNSAIIRYYTAALGLGAYYRDLYPERF